MPRRPPAFPVLKLGDEGVVDCCGDGSVLKLTKKAARARHVKSPVDGDECTTHKRGWLAENPCKEGEFEDSKEGGEPYQFLVGGGGAVKGLSDAVRRMRRGEVAYVWMAGHKGLGEEGNPPKIPKHAALCFELELLKFTDGKDVSPEMDGSVLTRRVKKGASRPRGFLSPHDKSTITFDYELWVTGTSVEPLDRPLANVGAVWYGARRRRCRPCSSSSGSPGATCGRCARSTRRGAGAAPTGAAASSGAACSSSRRRGTPSENATDWAARESVTLKCRGATKKGIINDAVALAQLALDALLAAAQRDLPRSGTES